MALASSSTKSRIDRCSAWRRRMFEVRCAVRAVAEQSLERPAGVELGADRRRRAAPGEVVLVGAGVPGVARAALADVVGRQLERRQPREVADAVGHHLVDRRPGLEHGGALLEADAGQERAVGPRVVAAAVRAADGGLVVETLEDLQDLLVLLERLERLAELEARSLRRSATTTRGSRRWGSRRTRCAAAPPVAVVASPGAPPAAAVASAASALGRRHERLQRRQRDADAEALEEEATRRDGGSVPAFIASHSLTFACSVADTAVSSAGAASPVASRRRWNGADSMTPASRAENRPPSASIFATIWSTVSTS